MKFIRKEFFVVCSICVLVVMLSGCIGLAGRMQGKTPLSAPTQTDDSKQETAAPPTSAFEVSKASDAEAKKAEFKDQAELIEVYSTTAYASAKTQLELNRESAEIYAKWDTLLNDIYLYLKQTMSPTDFAALEADEEAWVQQKEKVMEAAAAGWKGGSGEPMARNSAGIAETSQRCYYLMSLIR